MSGRHDRDDPTPCASRSALSHGTERKRGGRNVEERECIASTKGRAKADQALYSIRRHFQRNLSLVSRHSVFSSGLRAPIVVIWHMEGE